MKGKSRNLAIYLHEGRAETKKYEIASPIHLATKVYLVNLNPFFTHLFKMLNLFFSNSMVWHNLLAS
jgi:hypothetical protein